MGAKNKIRFVAQNPELTTIIAEAYSEVNSARHWVCRMKIAKGYDCRPQKGIHMGDRC